MKLKSGYTYKTHDGKVWQVFKEEDDLWIGFDVDHKRPPIRLKTFDSDIFTEHLPNEFSKLELKLHITCVIILLNLLLQIGIILL